MPTLKGEIKVVLHAKGPNYNNNLLFFHKKAKYFVTFNIW